MLFSNLVNSLIIYFFVHLFFFNKLYFFTLRFKYYYNSVVFISILCILSCPGTFKIKTLQKSPWLKSLSSNFSNRLKAVLYFLPSQSSSFLWMFTQDRQHVFTSHLGQQYLAASPLHTSQTPKL